MSTSTAHDLGLIIPTAEEFGYIRESIPFTPITAGEGGVWYEFTIPGGRRGVAHVLFDMGLVAATAAAARLLEKFHPDVLAVVGIGGALSDELRLGDVVVGDRVEEYLKAAKASSDSRKRMGFEPAGDGWPLAERLRTFANHFRFITDDSYQAWIRFAGVRGVEAGLPFATTPGARHEPRYFVLPIASGDLVVADEAFRTWLLSHQRRRAVVEMEAAGVARAVKEYDRDVPLLVIRGISDFADNRKTLLDAVASREEKGAWRRYATRNAIELLLAFLASPRFPWRSPTRPSTTETADATLELDGSAVGLALPARGAWDYFVRAAQVVEVTAAGVEIIRFLHPHHAPAEADHHGSHHDAHGGGDGSHGHQSDNDHGHEQNHGEHHPYDPEQGHAEDYGHAEDHGHGQEYDQDDHGLHLDHGHDPNHSYDLDHDHDDHSHSDSTGSHH